LPCVVGLRFIFPMYNFRRQFAELSWSYALSFLQFMKNSCTSNDQKGLALHAVYWTGSSAVYTELIVDIYIPSSCTRHLEIKYGG